MLTETAPISFQDKDQNIDQIDLQQHDFVQLMNHAWKRYEQDMKNYPNWESVIISDILGKVAQ